MRRKLELTSLIYNSKNFSPQPNFNSIKLLAREIVGIIKLDQFL